MRYKANQQLNPPADVHGLFGGKGLFRRASYYSDKDGILPFTVIGETEMEPGSYAGIHTQPDQHELLYILEGQGSFTMEGETMEVKQGDALMAPAGTNFALSNTSAKPLRYLVVKCRV